MIFRSLQVEKTIHMKCRNAGDCPIIHIKFPGSPALPPHGMKVMSEARKMMTSSQLCHPPGAVTAFPGTDLTTKRCSRPIRNRIPNGRESCSQGLGILFPRLGNPVPGAWESDSQPAVHFRIRAAFPTGRVLSWEQYRFIQIPQRHHSTLKTDVHCRTVTRLSLIGKQT